MERNQKCIQSFAPHGVEFIDHEATLRGEFIPVLVIPAGSVEKNMVVADEALIESLMKNDNTFKALLSANLIRILDNVPKKYENPAETLMTARAILSDVRIEKDKIMAEKNSLSDENALLKKRIADLENGDDLQKKPFVRPTL